MANTFVKIATVTVGAGGTSAIDFSSIPSTYTDLLIRCSMRTNFASNSVAYVTISQFNGSSTGFTQRFLYGNGSGSPASGNNSGSIGASVSADGNTASTFGSTDFYIPNYAGSSNKSVSVDSVSENNATFAETWLNAGLWSNTAAITSLRLTPSQGTLFMQYSTATLYGISKS